MSSLQDLVECSKPLWPEVILSERPFLKSRLPFSPVGLAFQATPLSRHHSRRVLTSAQPHNKADEGTYFIVVGTRCLRLTPAPELENVRDTNP